jgi:hypothetical protein
MRAHPDRMRLWPKRSWAISDPFGIDTGSLFVLLHVGHDWIGSASESHAGSSGTDAIVAASVMGRTRPFQIRHRIMTCPLTCRARLYEIRFRTPLDRIGSLKTPERYRKPGFGRTFRPDTVQDQPRAPDFDPNSEVPQHRSRSSEAIAERCQHVTVSRASGQHPVTRGSRINQEHPTSISHSNLKHGFDPTSV